MDFKPSNLIFHDYGGSPANADGVFNPYHALVFPDGNIRYRNPSNPYGGKAPHAYKMNPESIGLSYAGPVGSKPTPQALATLRKETAKIAQMFPGIQPMSHGQAFNATKGTAKQASKLGRGLDEASWRSNIVYGPPAPGQSEPQPATPMAGRSLTAYAGLSGPKLQAQPAPAQNEAPTMPNQTGVPIPASYSPDTISAQRRMAMQLMQQGTDASPVQHLTQALARVLQGGMGGYQMAQADKQDRMMQGEGNALMGQFLGSMTGGPSPAGMPQGQPQMVGQALAGETAPMTQDQQNVGRFASSGLAAAMPQPAPVVPPAGPVQVADAGPTVSPEILQQMLANPQTRDMAQKYIMQRAKPASAADKPSNIQEWEYFQSLHPEAQQKYIAMKRGEKFLDAGTQFVNPRTGEVVTKDLAGAERDKEVGTAQGKQIAAAPGDLATADEALALIDSLRADPNREWGTGMSSMLNVVPGTPGKSYQLKVNQARSGAFLTAIQQLRGMGALSNAEGQTATDAVTRLTTADTEEGFLQALADYEKVVRAGRDRAIGRLQQAPAQARPDIKSKYQGLE